MRTAWPTWGQPGCLYKTGLPVQLEPRPCTGQVAPAALQRQSPKGGKGKVMAQEPLNSSLGQVISGNVLDAHTFQASVVTAQLFQLATDPRKTEDERQVRDNPDLEAIR